MAKLDRSPGLSTDTVMRMTPTACQNREPQPPRGMRWSVMLRPWQWFGTLKVRLAAGVLAVLLVGMAWSVWQMGQAAEVEILAQAQRREEREAQRTASAITRRLAELQRALALVASRMDPALVDQPARLEAFMVSHPTLLAGFHYVNVAGVDGAIRISVDEQGTSRPPVSIADRPHFRRAVAERRAQISDPLPGRIAGEPVVVLAQPVLEDDRARAMLLGVLRLTSRDLLGELEEARTDEAGTHIVVTDRHGTILAHPQRALVMHSLGDDPRLARAYREWEARGRPQRLDAALWRPLGEIVAVAEDSAAGWLVWRAVPRAQLLAPLRVGRGQAQRLAAAVAAVLSALTVAFVAWQLRPLRRLELRAQQLAHGDVGAAIEDWPVAGGEIGRLTNTLREVWAERARVESVNRDVLAKLRSLMAAAPVGLCFTRHRRFELVSDAFCAQVGRRERELVGQSTEMIFASRDDYLALGPQVQAAFDRGEPYVGEWQIRRADGSLFWARLRGRPVEAGNPDAGTIWSLNDISDQVAARQQLERAALHDPLTGVANRKGFDQALARVFAAPATQRPASIVMIDLDRFKTINDTAGHAAGDAMLVAVAEAIVATVRDTDVVARLGGDEFAVLLPRCTGAQAAVVAEEIRRAIDAIALPWQGRPLSVGASLGVAELDESHPNAAQWFIAADEACYAAKRRGRGSVNWGTTSHDVCVPPAERQKQAAVH